MLINLRNALMTGKRLPYDAEVEYLESYNGLQYIDTGLTGADLYQSGGFEIDCTPMTMRSYTPVANISNDRNFNFMGLNNSTTTIYSRFNDALKTATASTFNITTFLGERTVQKALGRTYTIKCNGITATGTYSQLCKNNSEHLCVFYGGTYSSSHGWTAKFRVHSAKCWTDTTTLVRDFIPVRKGTVGYLYDRVSGKLFGNAGTGDFALGPDVVPVEYLQSSGTQYIDTGVALSSNCRVVCDWTALGVSSGTSAYAFGAYGGGMNFGVNIVAGSQINAGEQYCVWGPSSTLVGQGLKGIRHVLDLSASGLFRDGVKVFSPSGSFTSNKSAYLFWANGTGQGKSLAKMYRAEFYDNIGTPVRSFRPVRVGTDATSWEGAMMDVLTRRIYRNAGTGAFGYGNDLKYPIPAS